MTNLEVNTDIPDTWEIVSESEDFETRSNEYKYQYSGGDITVSIVKVFEDEYRVIFWHNNTTSELPLEDPETAISVMVEHMRGLSNSENPYVYYNKHLFDPNLG